MDPDVERALAYHDRTKHHLPQHFARSPAGLDWDNQPNPFRLYEGAELVALAQPAPDDGPPLDRLYDPARVVARPVDHTSVSQLFFDALALSAWKRHGSSRWSLRCNPSSGNLHPTEAHLVCGVVPGLCDAPNLFHYAPLLHALERRATLDEQRWRALAPSHEGLLVVLTSIHWREAWKYGERAYRYCQHDVGHAMAALSFAAAALGWQVRMVPGVDDAGAARLAGIADQRGPDAEHVDVVLAVGPALGPACEGLAVPLDHRVELAGRPNVLSHEHRAWPIIEETARACARRGPVAPEASCPGDLPEPAERSVLARRLFRTRRSAVALDGATGLGAADFFHVLSRLEPRAGHVPFAALRGRPRVHLCLFVHRVSGLAPGLYLLLRDPTRLEAVRAALHPAFAYEPVETGTLALPLFALELGDVKRVARTIACHQQIAADGAFAVAMLAEMDEALARHGAWFYRHLFWEAGAVGQVLYLEAEAAGLRGTGIGCFFDDGLHELVGVRSHALQSLYHFTLGAPVDDPRLQMLDAYHHLA